MRIVLRGDSEQFTIVRAFEARDAEHVREFSSEHVALSFLHSVAPDDLYAMRLRHGLERARETTDVMRMSDLDVLRMIASLISSGVLKVVSSALERGTLDLGEGTATGKSEPGKAPPIEHKPGPIVPQEYPILARVESSEVINSTRGLVAALQELMHVLFKRTPPPSQLAREYVSNAGEVASNSRLTLDRLHIGIEQLLFRNAPLRGEKPSVPIEFRTLGKAEGTLSKSAIQSFSAGLDALLWEKKDSPGDVPQPRVLRGVGTPLRGALETGKADTPPPEKPPESKAPVPKTSILFKVQWSDTGAPVGSVKLKIKLPAGNETEPRTNQKGEIYLGGIAEGACDVSSDIKGATRKTVLELGGTGKAPAQGTSLVQYKVAKIERYKVKTGDTLDTLAAKVGMSAGELAKFNWGSDDPKVITQCLRLEVGCTKKSPDGKSYVFDDSDTPGIVLLPSPMSETGLATGGEHLFSVGSLDVEPKPWIFSL